jgi:hypothetical protein
VVGPGNDQGRTTSWTRNNSKNRIRGRTRIMTMSKASSRYRSITRRRRTKSRKDQD